MILPLLLVAVQAAPSSADQARHARCVRLAQDGDPAAALVEAERWRGAGGGFLAEQCAGLAHAAAGRWSAAAAAFEGAAAVAPAGQASQYQAQAGNAWLAANEPAKARAALDKALAGETLVGLALGEAQLDRARALVAGGDLAGARVDLDQALVNAADDPLAWLLSATLARRTGEIARARKDIGEALRRSSDDASVQLEAGNIAALARDEAGARAAWAEAARLAPDRPAGRNAAAALKQFDTPAQGAPR